MPIRVELSEAEAALTCLTEAIKRTVNSPELRKEYYTLLQQACIALNKVRSIWETSDWLNKFQKENGSSSAGEQ